MFRLISAVAFFWLLRMLFPDQKKISFVGSLLFLICPGFLSQVNGVDYQSQILALAAALLSIALTIRAILSDRLVSKVTFHILSVLLGLLYLSQMEWYIGFEIFRWACVLLISLRIDGSIVQKLVRAVRLAYPALIGDIEHLTELAPAITSDKYISLQTCQILDGMTGLSDSVVDAIRNNYCVEQ